MRLSDLLHAEVFGPDDERLGRVLDVRMVQDGPLLEPWGAAFRVHGLIVGPRIAGTMLGFERAQVHGPALLKALFHSVERHARYVEWPHVVSAERGCVRVDVAKDQMGDVEDING
jgi:hypothetical protein